MSTAPPSRKKRYHKRSSWACDECKLRKKKCDGEQPCAMCILIGRPCTYESRTRPHKTPTQLARDLEEQARAYRDTLIRIRPELSVTSALEVDRLLSIQDSASEESLAADSPASSSKQMSSAPLASMLSGSGRFLEHDSAKVFFGPYSGAALIYAMLETFEDTDSDAMTVHLIDLFAPNVPVYDTIEAALTDQGLVLPSIHDLTQFYQEICDQLNPVVETDGSIDVELLFEEAYACEMINKVSIELGYGHTIAALGFLVSASHDSEKGCAWYKSRSEQHYHKAWHIWSLLGIAGLRSLEATVLLIRYDVLNFNIHRAYTSLGTVKASIIRQGFHIADNQNVDSSRRTQILAGLEILDFYVSTLLDLPPMLNLPCYGVTNLEEDTALHCSTDVQLAHGICTATTTLLKKMSSSLSKAETITNTKPAIDQSFIEQIGQDITNWTQFSEKHLLDLDPVAALIKETSMMASYWAELTLYSPFLHYLQPLAAGQSLNPTHSEPALRCLRVATIAINQCEMMLRARNEYSKPPVRRNDKIWILFLSTMSLIFLICVHKGINPPGEAWRKAETGIKLLYALECPVRCPANRCLAVIKAFTRQLQAYVHFDFDLIERSTQSLCLRDHGKETEHNTNSGQDVC